MEYPRLKDTSKTRDIITYFQGYNHTLTCQEGAFYEAKNISTEEFPVLSPRRPRGISKTFDRFQGIADKDGLVWIDDNALYINNVEKQMTGVVLTEGRKTITKMGAYIVIWPDKVWYNTKDDTYGYIENKNELEAAAISFSLCAADGTGITAHPSSYYKPDGSVAPTTGAYKIDTVNGKTSLSVYSAVTGLWAPVPTTYMKIEAQGISTGFENGDGVKITVDLTGISWEYAKNIFVNEEDEGKRSSNFVIYDKGENYITVPALLDANKSITTNMEIYRKAPDMAFITECANRLWGCSTDGHEIYCCKLGDVKNWNCFAGISTDSYVATIGSDGVFTGAITYMGYPIFFKENSLIRVSVSSIGAHALKETICRGVQEGSDRSLVQLNEVLYYKSAGAVCVYDGSFPSEVSEALGEVRYHEAVGGSVNNRYYVSMKDDSETPYLFVYDTKVGLWAKEDSIPAEQFATSGDELYLVADNKLYSVGGTNLYGSSEQEAPVFWLAESGKIGFASPDNKNIQRINLRMSLGLEATLGLFIQYDSCGAWEHLFDMSGKRLQSFTIPIRPHRCDHFKLMFRGHGEAKIYSLTKTVEDRSDR